MCGAHSEHSINIGHFYCNLLYATQIQGRKLFKVRPKVFVSLPGDPVSVLVCSLPTDAHQLVLVIAVSREESLKMHCAKSDSTNIGGGPYKNRTLCS